ncbi:MAG: MFS transporter [Phycisphaerales bacterium]
MSGQGGSNSIEASGVGARAAPRWSTYGVTFLGSIGTGAAINGISFIATETYGFSRVANWSLAIASSVCYIGAALFAGPVLRGARRLMPRFSSRGSLAALSIAMAACCAFPYLVRGAWTIWVFMSVYAALSGALWPVVEAFLSGGRRGRSLRHTIGGFNIIWSSAVAFSFWIMSPIMPHGPLRVILLLGVVHLATLPLLAAFPREPGRHHDSGHSHDPEELALYRRLLHGFRILLLLSYAFMSTVNPVLPLRLREFQVPLEHQTLLSSVWMTVRIGVFALMMVWGGWHGRVRTMVWSCATMLVGFACVMLGPGVGWLVAGLALLGVGVGAVYSAAIYYALEAGNAEVDAGGKHEALIGLGYLGGPALSLTAAGFVPPGERDLAAAAAVGLLSVALTIAAFAMVRPRRGS